MVEPLFPQRLDIKDMPRDEKRCLGSLRKNLCNSFNYCRSYPKKMAVLKTVLKYTYNRIVQYEKEVEAHQKAAEAVAAVPTQPEGQTPKTPETGGKAD